MEKFKYTFQSSEKVKYNDVSYPTSFGLTGFSYKFILDPQCQFWRFGLRFAMKKSDLEFDDNLKRYSDNQIAHLEVCAGEVENNIWVHPNHIHLQQYHMANTDPTLDVCDRYIEKRRVELSIQSNGQGLVRIQYQTEGCKEYIKDIYLGFQEYFKVFAWSDNREFSLDCVIEKDVIPLTLMLKEIKALSNQKLTFTIERLAILFGRNNCGKTSILIGACNDLNSKHIYAFDHLGINRFYTESEYDFKLEDDADRNKIQERNRIDRGKNRKGQHISFDWIHELALQDEETRAKITDWFSTHFEKWEFVDQKSGRYLTGRSAKVNGLEPIDQGTGARAVLPIISQLFNPNVELLTIDEPELGLEPHTQRIVFKAIKEASMSENGFPFKRIMIATHSHLFLDRERIENNFHVQKIKGDVIVTQVQSLSDLQDASFRLLGNNPSDLFFPSNIIVVEGISDHIFLKAIYLKMLKEGLVKKNIVFHYLEGIDKAAKGIEGIVQMLKTQSYIPVYKDKICALFDKPDQSNTTRIERIRKDFEDHSSARFVTLPLPGIEYYYPLDIVNNEFQSTLNANQYHLEIHGFYESIAGRFPFRGKFLDREISKRELSQIISTAFLQNGSLSDIDDGLVQLIIKADLLGF